VLGLNPHGDGVIGTEEDVLLKPTKKIFEKGTLWTFSCGWILEVVNMKI
jgi:4-hydroxy-L-threonine phosphate dehydrogenase PdxA